MSKRLILASGAFLLCCLGLFLAVDNALAQATTPPTEATPAPAPAPAEPLTFDKMTDSQKIEELKKLSDAGSPTGHIAWMLTSSALVLFMTIPGLAMFYGGLVRKKNVLGVLMQCLALMGIMTVVWALYGYSLSFGGDPKAKENPGSPFIGNADFVMMKDVKMTPVKGMVDGKEAVIGNATPYETAIPRLLHMVFQGMFFIITPALICGAFAERMKFSAMVIFSILWGTFIYCPLCHMVWDGGLLAFGSPVAIAGGALDFAGGTVVHISSGVSALVCALIIGKRVGFGTSDMRPHNLTFTVLGAGMLWVGWFGFNGGSATASNDLAVSAFVVTHFAAAAGAIAWAGVEWITRKHASVLGAASGAVAGLVVITPAAGYVHPMPAIVMGLLAGVVCYLACTKLKNALGYDDSLDAFGVHGVGGTLGAILTGIFATTEVNYGGADGLFYNSVDGAKLLVGQLVATAITWVIAIVGSIILLKVIDLTIGLRVSQDDEQKGLDVSQHGEEGYIFN